MALKKKHGFSVKGWIQTRKSSPMAFNDCVKYTHNLCRVYGSQLGEKFDFRMVPSCFSSIFLISFTAGNFLHSGFDHPNSSNNLTSVCLSGATCSINLAAAISWRKRTALYREFEKFSDDLCSQMTSPSEREALARANFGRRISVIYPFCVLFVWMCFTCTPIVLRQRRLSTDVWPMPCDISDDFCLYPMYILVVAIWYSTLILYMFVDVSNVVLVQYSGTVFRALQASLKDMALTLKGMDTLEEEDQAIVQEMMRRKLKSLIKIHQFILRWTKEWTRSNKSGVVARLVICPLLIVTALIKMLQVPIKEQGEVPAALAIVLGSMYIISAISDGLDFASSSVAKGVYESGWEFLIHDREYVRNVQIIIFRASRPVRMPGIINDVTLHDFVNVCKSGYRFFQAARNMMPS